MADLQVSELPLISQITTDDMLIVNDGNATTSIISWANALASITALQGQVRFDSGVETLPSIAFVNDISTGIYNPANNELGFVTGAIQRGVFDSGGRFGIANYTPGVYNEGANNLVIGDIDLGDNGLTIVSGDVNAGVINFADGTGLNASQGQIVYDHSDDHMGFFTSGTEAVRINFEGDLTVGTSVNQLGSKITVDGGSVTVRQGSSSQLAANFIGDSDTGYYSPGPNMIAVVTAGQSQLFIDGEGDLGVGTSDPQQAIHIARSNPKIRIEDTDHTSNAYAEASTISGDIILDADPSQLADDSTIQIRVDNEEQIRVNSDGQLIVRSDIFFNDPGLGTPNSFAAISHEDTTGSIIVSADPDDQYADSELKILVDGSPKVEIKANGDINMAADGNLTFDADPDTYFYHPAQDQLAVATGGVERIRFGDLGHLMVGSTTPRFIGTNSPGLQVSGNAPTASAAFMIYSPDAQGTGVHIGKSRSSTIGGVATVQPGDQLGYVAFSGTDGNSFNAVGASVAVVVDNAVGTQSVPSSLVLNTTGLGQTNPVQRLQIESSGTTRILNTPTDGIAFAVGPTGSETFKVMTSGDVTLDDVTIDEATIGVAHITTYDIESLPSLP